MMKDTSHPLPLAVPGHGWPRLGCFIPHDRGGFGSQEHVAWPPGWQESMHTESGKSSQKPGRQTQGEGLSALTHVLFLGIEVGEEDLVPRGNNGSQ
jgi:hypothetical protein